MWVGYLPRNVVTIPAHCALVPPCSSAVKEAAVLPEHPRKVSAVTASVTLDGGGATAVSVVLTEDREAAVVVTAGELSSLLQAGDNTSYTVALDSAADLTVRAGSGPAAAAGLRVHDGLLATCSCV